MTAVDSANNAVEISPPQLLSDFRVHMNIKIQLYCIYVCAVLKIVYLLPVRVLSES